MAAGNWPIFSASPIPYYEGRSDTPIELTRVRMDQIRDDFVAAALRGARAGFDMLELHCAHGYLLASFLSPLTNRRADEYGGEARNRARFPVEVFATIREVWPWNKPMSVRLSCADWAPGGFTLDDLAIVARAFKEAGADIIHCSSGQTVPWQKPVYGRMWQTPFAEFVRHAAGIPTIAVGDITLPEQINTIVAASRADLMRAGAADAEQSVLRASGRGALWREDRRRRAHGLAGAACIPANTSSIARPRRRTKNSPA